MNNKPESWEKEFDEKFVGQMGWKEILVYRDGGKKHITEVKSFIRSLLASKNKAWLKRFKTMLKLRHQAAYQNQLEEQSSQDLTTTDLTDYYMGAADELTEVLDKLKEMETE